MTTQDMLAELVSYIAPERVQPVTRDASDPHVQMCYKLRFDAAEARYARMKAVVCAVLTERLQAAPAKESPESDELVRLREINRCLRNGIRMELPPWEKPSENAASLAVLQAQLVTARAQITAMDLELARLNDKKFEEDERAREYEDVFHALLRSEHLDPGPVHPRFHPIATCADAGCREYAKRLRNGLRQSIAEVTAGIFVFSLPHVTVAQAYVRDRCVRMYGHFRRVVEPVERLRSEKDAEIARLWRRIKQLECAAFMTAEEAETMPLVNRELVEALARVEEARSAHGKLVAECAELESRRGVLQANVLGLQTELSDANRTIDSVGERVALCKAERCALERERESVQQIWLRIDAFTKGDMARDYAQKRLELDRLERDINALRECVDEMDVGTGKRVRV